MDYALTRGDGLSACFRLKQRPHPPGVVLYSAYVDDIFAVPATLAQADAIVSKNDPVEILLAAIDAVAAGESRVPPLDPELIEAASAGVDAEDLPIVGMLFARVQVDDIATTLGVEPREVRARALRIIGEMQAQDRRQGALAGDGSVDLQRHVAPLGPRGLRLRRALRDDHHRARREPRNVARHGAQHGERQAPRPREPTTISSAPMSAATSASTTAGSPSRTSRSRLAAATSDDSESNASSASEKASSGDRRNAPGSTPKGNLSTGAALLVGVTWTSVSRAPSRSARRSAALAAWRACSEPSTPQTMRRGGGRCAVGKFTITPDSGSGLACSSSC